MAISYSRKKNPSSKIRLRPRSNPAIESLLLINPRTKSNPCGRRRNPAKPSKPAKPRKPAVKRPKKAISSEELRKPRKRTAKKVAKKVVKKTIKKVGRKTELPRITIADGTGLFAPAFAKMAATQAVKIEKQKAQIKRLKKGEKKMAKRARKKGRKPSVKAAAGKARRRRRPTWKQVLSKKVIRLPGRRISYLRKSKAGVYSRVIRKLGPKKKRKPSVKARKKARKVAAARKPRAKARIRRRRVKHLRGWKGIKQTRKARKVIKYYKTGKGKKARASSRVRKYIARHRMRTNPGFADIKALVVPVGIALLAFIAAGAIPKIQFVADQLAKNATVQKWGAVIGALGIGVLAYLLTRKGKLAKFQIPALIGAGVALGVSILKAPPVQEALGPKVTKYLSDYVPVRGYGYSGIEAAGGVVDRALLEQGGYIPQNVADYIERPAAYAGYVEQLSADVQEALSGVEVEEGLAGVSAAEALGLAAGGQPVMQRRDIEMDEITVALNKGSLAGSSL